MFSTVMFECVTAPSTLPRGCFYYNPYIFAVIMKKTNTMGCHCLGVWMTFAEVTKFEDPRIRHGSEGVK